MMDRFVLGDNITDKRMRVYTTCTIVLVNSIIIYTARHDES